MTHSSFKFIPRFFTTVVLLCVISAARESTSNDNGYYSGHKLIRIIPQDGRQVEILQQMLINPPNQLKGLDFWNDPSVTMNTVDVRVEPKQLGDLQVYIDKLGLPYSVVVPDLQSVIESHEQENKNSKSIWRLSVYESYLNFDEMEEWLVDSSRRCGSRCLLLDIGKSFEGRPLYVLKIFSPGSKAQNNKEGTSRQAVWVDAGTHAREWISHSTALYFIDRLINDYDVDPDVRDMLESYDWYVMPAVNPDGYQYSHTTNRLWRKTRSRSKDLPCIGVDANRNFEFHWGSIGTSDDSCSNRYQGPKPFSEPETEAVRDFIMTRNGTWKLFLTLHSFGQKWMTPYGYTNKNKPTNFGDMMLVATAAARSLKNVYGTEYSVGSASQVLYQSSGTSRDWAAGMPRIPFVYTIELRDSGEHKFLLPSSQILSTGIETWEGVKTLIRHINRLADLKETINIRPI